jgi:hypothetical protein
VKRALLAVALLLAAVLVPPAVTPADAATLSGACPSSKGVTVVVDFGKLGGGTQVRCDSRASAGTNGVAALEGAGFALTGTATYGLAFICKIDAKPSNQSCHSTPPATAYWSYWHASNGGSWTYSTKGASNRTVTVGGFEGWRFQEGKAQSAPGVTPLRIVVSKPSPKPTHSSSGSSQGSGQGSGSGSGSGNGSAGSAKGAVSGPSSDHPTKAGSSPSTTGPGSSPSASASATSTTGTPSAEAVGSLDNTLPGDGPSTGPSHLPLALGGLGVAALLAGTGVVVGRRRRSGDD